MPSPRCFVALWPDPEARVLLARETVELCARCPRARPVAASNLHLTLAFIGALASDRADALARDIDRLAVEATRPIWHVDRLGGFGGAQVAWAGGDAAVLQPIAAAVRALLDHLGIGYDPKPFVPHVTLARRVAAIAAGSIVPPIRWRIGAPRLVVSAREAGALHYRDWPLPR